MTTLLCTVNYRRFIARSASYVGSSGSVIVLVCGERHPLTGLDTAKERILKDTVDCFHVFSLHACAAIVTKQCKLLWDSPEGCRRGHHKKRGDRTAESQC